MPWAQQLPSALGRPAAGRAQGGRRGELGGAGAEPELQKISASPEKALSAKCFPKGSGVEPGAPVSNAGRANNQN